MDEHIKNILLQCEIDSEVNCQFGNWLVMEDATLINVGGAFSTCGYVIESDILDNEDWIEKFKSQGRLTESFDIPNFKSAYFRACEILNTHKKQ